MALALEDFPDVGQEVRVDIVGLVREAEAAPRRDELHARPRGWPLNVGGVLPQHDQ